MYMYTELIWKGQDILSEGFSRTKSTALTFTQNTKRLEHELDTASSKVYTCTVQSLPAKVRNLATQL